MDKLVKQDIMTKVTIIGEESKEETKKPIEFIEKIMRGTGGTTSTGDIECLVNPYGSKWPPAVL